MTAGVDKMIRIFHVDCETNPIVQSVYVKDMPILCGSFHSTGSEILVSGRRPYIYVYDLVKEELYRTQRCRDSNDKSFEKFVCSKDGAYIAVVGVDGNVLLFNGRTKTFVTQLKNPVHVTSIQFTEDGTYIVIFGNDGCLYVWDLRTRKCIQRVRDEGTIHGTVLDVSHDTNYVAAGSDSGVTNIYEWDTLLQYKDTKVLTNCKPKATLLSLRTSISKIIFSPTNEFVVTASRMKRDAISISHIPTFTTFTNWPGNTHALRYVQDIDISPHGGLLSIANEKGHVLLYRLQHYSRV
uniref:Uncharacterized protein n=1 Tax=Lygus hesperus TaxID=30085 RepID=A0A0A9W496_LYGHE